MLRLLLEESGLTVEEAENGQVGVEKAMTGRFDVILMDLSMPDVDGFEATGRIRRQEELSDVTRPIHIVALTAHAFEQDRNHCLANGMDGFLTKPLAFEELEKELNRLRAAR